MVTMHSGDDQIFAAMEAGASAFVGKDAPERRGRQGGQARRGVASFVPLCRPGRRHDAPSVGRVDAALRPGAPGAGAPGRRPGRRPDRPALYLSESTAKSHIARIYQKLGASNRAQALVTAMRIGLLSSLPTRDLRGLRATERFCCRDWAFPCRSRFLYSPAVPDPTREP